MRQLLRGKAAVEATRFGSAELDETEVSAGVQIGCSAALAPVEEQRSESPLVGGRPTQSRAGGVESEGDLLAVPI
ncbi:MAG TPA: hypothetical protein VFB44_10100 [Thermoleophilaceae bacterium]|nr:hypothetical protein [Thermoleophilaceae bacterium]